MTNGRNWEICSQKWSRDALLELIANNDHQQLCELVLFARNNLSTIQKLARLYQCSSNNMSEEYSDLFIELTCIDNVPYDVLKMFEADQKREDQKKGFKKGETYVYMMKCNRNGAIKIGQSRQPKCRETTLQSEDPSIEMIGSWRSFKMVEKILHEKFQHLRLRGEWFKMSQEDIELAISIIHKNNENAC